MIGVILIIISSFGLILGILLLAKQTKTPIKKKIELTNANRVVEKVKYNTQTTEKDNKTTKQFDENKEKGDAFEKYIVHKFDKKLFKLKEWRSDKYTDGIYPESSHFPDLEVEFSIMGKSEIFAIECKWRADYYKGGIEWAKDYQFKNYKSFLEKRNIPVFLVLGVGGTPNNPEELFTVPVHSIDNHFVSKSFLELHKKKHIESNFFYDANEDKLR